MRKVFLLLCTVSALYACNDNGNSEAKKALEQKGDILAINADTTVRPGDDFFQFANGAWMKANAIPATESSWGIAYLVNEELYKRKRKINEEAVDKTNSSGVDKQIGDFWATAMDSAGIEQQGIRPLQEELNRIYAVASKEDVMAEAARLHTMGVGAFFSEGAGQDAMRSDVMAYYISQGGLGLPNRDYYFNTDERTAKVRAAYPGYVREMFRLLGNADSMQAGTKTRAIIALETKLAKASRKLEDLRDPYKNYNKMSTGGLQKLSPAIQWTPTLAAIGVPQSIDTVIIGQPEFITTLNGIIATEPVQNLKDYMAFHFAREYAPYLSKAFVDANFNFYSKIVRGAQEQRPRWKRVLDAEEGALGEALGKLFAKEYFNEKAKGRYSEMVEGIREAYRKRIERLDWMTDSTKQKAYAKLSSMKKKVGYPDKWKDFSAMKIGRSSYAQNMMEASRWENNYELNKLGKPVDRDEWDMTPQTYNAYYNPSNNEIVLPAGIFTVPGYRDEELDDAMVYGYAAASTIGHEITHGFDDEGRQYDEQGNLHNWWTKTDEEQFKKRSEVLAAQFSKMVVVDSLKINGKATLGENLADLGGLLLGVDAFKLTAAYKKGDRISGYTPMQRFFLGYALGWLYSVRAEELASRVLTDVHSPAKQRVNGPMPNIPEFYEAFGVKPGDKLYLPDSARVRLW